eukprot:216909_1
MYTFLALICGFCIIFAQVPLNTITLPPGFNISVWADKATNGINEPRQLNVQFYKGATIVYVGTLNQRNDHIRALVDRDNDQKIDNSYIIFDSPGSNWPLASLVVSPENGQMFINSMEQSYKCDGNVNEQILSSSWTSSSRIKCSPWFKISNYSSDHSVHGLHFMRFNARNELCIAFGINCNECVPGDNNYKSTIRCFNTSTTISPYDGEIWARGIRNSFGFDFHPVTKEMWFTDNGRDNLLTTTNMPDDELNHVSFIGEHFGYPYCHSEGCGNPYQRDINCVTAISDPTIGSGFTKNCTTGFTLAKQPAGPHVGVLGMRFYDLSYETMFPAKYKNAIFFAQHGSWDRTPLIGYRVSVAYIEGNNTITGHDIFAQGWLNDTSQSVWGRVADVKFLSDGSMIVSDDQINVIYRIYYNVSQDNEIKQIEYWDKLEMGLSHLVVFTLIIIIITTILFVMLSLLCYKWCIKSKAKKK